MAALSDLSRDIAGILERAAAGIVRVDARPNRPATGIVWADGLVLTADHVIERDDAIQISAGGAAVKAGVAGRDPGTDLALLKTDGLTASPLARAASADVRIGHLVLAAGRANELQVSLGIVSGLSGAFRSWRGGETERLIETTAELLPGFSGTAGTSGVASAAQFRSRLPRRLRKTCRLTAAFGAPTSVSAPSRYGLPRPCAASSARKADSWW